MKQTGGNEEGNQDLPAEYQSPERLLSEDVISIV